MLVLKLIHVSKKWLMVTVCAKSSLQLLKLSINSLYINTGYLCKNVSTFIISPAIITLLERSHFKTYGSGVPGKVLRQGDSNRTFLTHTREVWGKISHWITWYKSIPYISATTMTTTTTTTTTMKTTTTNQSFLWQNISLGNLMEIHHIPFLRR